MQFLSVGFARCWFESVHGNCSPCSDVFNNITHSWELTCKWVMSLSMSSGEVTQLSGMYLKFWGQGSVSTALTHVIGTASYPREMSLRRRKILIFKCTLFFSPNSCRLLEFSSREYDLFSSNGNMGAPILDLTPNRYGQCFKKKMFSGFREKEQQDRT